MPQRLFAWRLGGQRQLSDMDLAGCTIDLAARDAGNSTTSLFISNRNCRLSPHSARDHDPLRRRRVRRGLDLRYLAARSRPAPRSPIISVGRENPSMPSSRAAFGALETIGPWHLWSIGASTKLSSAIIRRPSRSSRQMTRQSPCRKCDKASARPARSSRTPDALSSKMRSQPAAVRASRWRSRFWSSVETRA
jgi:hypothetical protein